MTKAFSLKEQIEVFNRSYIIRDDGCWEWQKATFTSFGYKYGRGILGRYPSGKCKPENAHRISYAIHNGELIPGMHIHHKCRNTLCVNPDHLEQLTPGQHMLENIGSAAWKALNSTHCKNGHEFSAERNKKNWRVCSVCQKNSSRKFKETKRFDRFSQERKFRSPQAEKTHCKLGHPYSGDNLSWRHAKHGSCRVCRTCGYIKSKYAYEKNMGRAVHGFSEFLENWEKYGLKQDPKMARFNT